MINKKVFFGWSQAYNVRNFSHLSHYLSITYASGKWVWKDFENLALACAYAGRVKEKHPDAIITLTEPCVVEPHFFPHANKILMSIKYVTIAL